MCNWYKYLKTLIRQTHSGGGDNIGRDKIIKNYLLGSVDYRQLEQEIKDAEELLAGIALDNIDLRLKQSAKVEELKQRLEAFKEDVFRLHEIFTRIPIDNERLRKARAHFDEGEFREADAVLKAEEIQQDVERLKLEKQAAKEKLSAIEQDLERRADEFLLKARLFQLNPVAEGEDRFRRTEGYFEQALAAARTAKALHDYALFLFKHNAFSRAEPLYQEALQQFRRNADAESDTFLPKVAGTLINLAALHYHQNVFKSALEEYQEAFTIRLRLAEENPEASIHDLMVILNNLVPLYSDQANFLSALEACKNALKLFNSFSEARQKAFLPYITTTLHNMAGMYQKKGEFDQALKVYQKTLEIRRKLAETNQEASLSGLSTTLNNLATLHYQTEEYNTSRKEFEEALEIRRRIAKLNPAAFFPDMADTLLGLGILHFYYTERTKSVAYAQEARSILIPLCKQAPHLQDRLDLAERLLEANKAKSL